eukprot:CAMPEP_0119480564 /NCGR_PEP_ID=MMETSP1344-20130328/9309_1 /TAXON_ID=236787 /ORGANISM="Florenciella parvula, Strain CCMP2471" /LENGTH=471 /DNA_ID=CAMNT_0007514885 /DNA_START=131 /DNA_END=1546 /DNA_ORIENTATION=+
MASQESSDFRGLVDCLFFPENVFDSIGSSSASTTPSAADAPASSSFASAGASAPASRRAAARGGARPGADAPSSKRQRTEKVGAGAASDTRTDNETSSNHSTSSDAGGDSDNPDEREENRKERNRRHARETRLRKKNYMHSLQQQLEAMTEERNLLEKEIQEKMNAECGQHSRWVKTVRCALALRAAGCPDVDQWRKFVDEEIVLVHPITPYRSFRTGDVVSNRCVLMGIPDIIQDASSLLVSLAALCKTGVHDAERKIKVQVRFAIDDEALHFSEEGLMCPFEMKTVNLEALGLRTEVSKNGCLRAQFNEEGRLKHLELCFDPISFWRQMQQANTGSQISSIDDLLLAPNTLEQALSHSKEARVVTEAARPFRITHVNSAWTDLCGFTQEEACGQTLRCLQGEDTDGNTVAQLVEDCNDGKATSMEVTNYDKEGKKFRNFLQVYPLTSEESSSGEISHMLGVLKPLGPKH